MRIAIPALAVAAVAVAAAIGFGLAEADETPVRIEDLPAGVTAAVAKRFPNARMVEAFREVEDGQTSFEVTIRDGETRIDVTLTGAGVLTGIEKTIDARELPKAVTDALGAEYPRATYETAEEVTKVEDGNESVAYYEVLLTTAGGKTFEVEVLPDGAVKSAAGKKEARKPERK